MTQDEILGYVAGYIDGDGCITVCNLKSKKQKPHLKCAVEIGSKFRRSVEYIQGVLGPGRITAEKDGTFRVRYWYGAASRVSALVLGHLYLKRRQAELVIRLNAMIARRGFRRMDGVPVHMLAERMELYRQVQLLNHAPCPLPEHSPRAKRRSFAYLAGIIDSDGCLRIERKGVEFSPVIHVKMKDGFVCRWITDKFGGYFLDPSPANDVYTWGAERMVAASVLRKIKPYLRLKQEQAEILIRLQRHKDLWKSRLHGGKLPDHVIEKRLAWKNHVSSLNQSADAEAKPTQPIPVCDGPICRDGKPAELPQGDLSSLVN